MRGDVWAVSEPGKGSTLHFTGWFEKSERKPVIRILPVSLKDKKVLIVDYNESALAFVMDIVKSAGMHATGVTTADQVMQAVESAGASGDPFDVCIISVQMPETSGYEIATQIRNLHPNSPQTALIALSFATERDAKKCLKAGFDGFLPKPVQGKKLIEMLERLLGEIKEGETQKKRNAIVTQHSIREDVKHSAHILLAEDNPVNQKLAKIMLKKAGYKVEMASNGKEAVEKFTSNPDDFDLIFMDIQMPEMDGAKATRTIRQKGFGKIPIVAMTAHAMKGDREKCLKAGMDDYITKPIKRELVFEMVEKWVLNKQQT
jgi:CheY-like chemotaxis protein